MMQLIKTNNSAKVVSSSKISQGKRASAVPRQLGVVLVATGLAVTAQMMTVNEANAYGGSGILRNMDVGKSKKNGQFAIA